MDTMCYERFFKNFWKSPVLDFYSQFNFNVFVNLTDYNIELKNFKGGQVTFKPVLVLMEVFKKSYKMFRTYLSRSWYASLPLFTVS